MVKIKFFTLLRILLKEHSMEVEIEEEKKILEVLKKAEKKVGKKFLYKLLDEEENLKRGTIILLNGENIFHLEKLETIVKNGDRIALFPPGGGG